MIYEVDSGRNVVDIHEQVLTPEGLGEPVMQPAGRADGIIAAVIDEHLAGHALRPGLSIPANTAHFLRITLKPCSLAALTQASAADHGEEYQAWPWKAP